MDVSLQSLAAVLTALGAFIGALVLAFRGLSGDRFSRKVAESASLLGGYTEMVKNLRIEITEIREDHDREVDRNKKQHQENMDRLSHLHKMEIDGLIAIYGEERKRWAEERSRYVEQMASLDERIDELGSQVYFLQNRPSETRQRADDPTTEQNDRQGD